MGFFSSTRPLGDFVNLKPGSIFPTIAINPIDVKKWKYRDMN